MFAIVLALQIYHMLLIDFSVHFAKEIHIALRVLRIMDATIK
jgi:hypothetical protein